MGLVEGSALDGQGIDEAFTLMVKCKYFCYLEILSTAKFVTDNKTKANGLKKESLQIDKNPKKDKKCCN